MSFQTNSGGDAYKLTVGPRRHKKTAKLYCTQSRNRSRFVGCSSAKE